MTTQVYNIAQDQFITVPVTDRYLFSVTPVDYPVPTDDNYTYVVMGLNMSAIYAEQVGYTAFGVHNLFMVGYGYNVYGNGSTFSGSTVSSGVDTLYVRPRLGGIHLEITPY